MGVRGTAGARIWRIASWGLLAALGWLLSWGVAGAQPGVPADRVTVARIELGRKVFHERALSANGTVSCADCHKPRLGFTDGLPVAVGIGGLKGTINTPTILGAAKSPLMFHDGRTTGIAAQGVQPITNPVEMGDQDLDDALARLDRSPYYRRQFAYCYGTRATPESVGRALGCFQSTLESSDAPIDRRLAGHRMALLAIQPAATGAAAERGFAIFMQAKCMECHSGPRFTDDAFHNKGVAFALQSGEDGRAGVLPQEQITARDVNAFKTPTLREIQRTAPYTHSGQVPNLREFVRQTSIGWTRPAAVRGRLVNARDRFQDERCRPLLLTDGQQEDLTTFLEVAFKGRNYPLVVRPAMPTR